MRRAVSRIAVSSVTVSIVATPDHRVVAVEANRKNSLIAIHANRRTATVCTATVERSTTAHPRILRHHAFHHRHGMLAMILSAKRPKARTHGRQGIESRQPRQTNRNDPGRQSPRDALGLRCVANDPIAPNALRRQLPDISRERRKVLRTPSIVALNKPRGQRSKMHAQVSRHHDRPVVAGNVSRQCHEVFDAARERPGPQPARRVERKSAGPKRRSDLIPHEAVNVQRTGLQCSAHGSPLASVAGDQKRNRVRPTIDVNVWPRATGARAFHG